jgi:hypothetical protein
MEALRHLAADASLDATTERLLTAKRQIKDYVVRARANPIEQRRMLQELDIEVAVEMLGASVNANDFWTAVREFIAQLLNQLPNQD